MRLTYLIMAHANPAQAAYLASRLLLDPEASILLHIDAKANQSAFELAMQKFGSRVDFLSTRQNIRWGNFASCQAELDLLRAAITSLPAAYYILLSGVDAPIRPWRDLQLELLSGSEYLNSWKMPDNERGKPLNRLTKYYFGTKNRNSKIGALVNGMLQRLPARDVDRGLGGISPYGGSQWWTLTHKTATRMVDFATKRATVVRFFKRSKNPDEMLFQTMLHAVSPDVAIRPALTYTQWTLGPSSGSPATLTAADMPSVQAASRSYFFARKFDWLDKHGTYETIERWLEDAGV